MAFLSAHFKFLRISQNWAARTTAGAPRNRQSLINGQIFLHHMFINELKKEFEEISVLFVVSLEPSVLFQDILNKILSIYYLNVSLSIFLLYCQRASPA